MPKMVLPSSNYALPYKNFPFYSRFEFKKKIARLKPWRLAGEGIDVRTCASIRKSSVVYEIPRVATTLCCKNCLPTMKLLLHWSVSVPKGVQYPVFQDSGS